MADKSMAGLNDFTAATETKVDTSKKMRVAIIGTGWIAGSHIKSLKKQPDVEIVAGADLIPGKAAKFFKDYEVEGVKTDYASHKELIDDKSLELDAVFICNRRARITHPKIIKGSMGAAFTKPIVEFSSVEECKSWLKKKNFKIYLTDTRATKTYFEESYEGRVALIVGSERYGITKPWYEGDYEMIMIPMLGQCDSLNVAIATTIIAYEASLKQKGFIKEKRK